MTHRYQHMPAIHKTHDISHESHHHTAHIYNPHNRPIHPSIHPSNNQSPANQNHNALQTPSQIPTSKSHSSTPTPPLLSTLKSNPELLYRIQDLLYALHKIKTNPVSEKRTLVTTDELYISAPYFTASQAALVKSALISPSSPPLESSEPPDLEDLNSETEYETPTTANTEPQTPQEIPTSPNLSVESTIKSHLSHFFKKRRASGDARPCGPHNLAPIYEHVFEVQRVELACEKFLARVKRCGLEGLVGMGRMSRGSKGLESGKGRGKARSREGGKEREGEETVGKPEESLKWTFGTELHRSGDAPIA